jgi:hypothetical protein
MAVIGATQLEPVNVLGSYVQGMELGRQARAQRQQETEALRAAQQEQALNALVQSGALTTPEGRNKLMQTPGGLAVLESYGKAQEQMGKGAEAQTKGLTSRMEYFRKNLPFNPQAAATWLTNAYADPEIGPELSKMGTLEQALSAIPTDPAAYLKWLEGSAMFADQYVERRVPTAESMLEYTQPMSPEVFEQQRALRATGAPRTTINMPAAGAFSKTLGEQAASRLDDLRTKAESARSTLQTSEQLLPLLDDPNFISGTLANARLAVAKAVGIDVSATEAYFAGIGQQVAERITAFGAGTGLSDADREFAKKIAGGEETLTVNAIRRIIRINNESARNVIGNYNEERTRLSKKEPEVLDYYPELSVPQAGRALGTQDQEALNWANANPNDPRSAQIKQRLGVQ